MSEEKKDIVLEENASTTNSPYTISDISMFMRDLGFVWSNQSQIYYNTCYYHINNKVAEWLYRSIIGDKSYEPVGNLINSKWKNISLTKAFHFKKGINIKV